MRDDKKISVALCLPAFNEQENIEKALLGSKAVLNDISDDWEIIVVDDGSTDATAQKVKALALSEPRIRLIQHPYNRGYGAALITAFYAAKKQWVWLSAADNQFLPDQIMKLLPHTPNYDLIIGFRQKRHDPPYRRLYAQLYNGLIRLMLGIRVKDINCGFKLIRREVFDAISLRSTGALVDAELFAKCKKHGYRLREVEVAHRPREFGTQTGGNIAVILRMFRELARMKLKDKI